MNFGDAIEILKEEGRVARQGWNGQDMFLYYVQGEAYPSSRFADSTVPYNPYIAMKTTNSGLTPWTASQADLLAEDWCEVVTIQINNGTYDVLVDDPMEEDPVFEALLEAFPEFRSGSESDECDCLICQFNDMIDRTGGRKLH